MTRDVGQITTRQAAVGLVGLALAITAIVTGLQALVHTEDRLPELEAPAGEGEPCPDPGTVRGAGELVSADRLIECPRSYDGQRVTYRGEAVRAALIRGDRAWLHLNDDPYALDLGPLPDHRTTVGGNSGIPVSVPREVAEALTHVGNHRARGDVLTVTGVFYRAHPDDAGAPAIHAITARIDRPGVPVTVTADRPREVVAAVLAALAAASVLAAQRARAAR